MLVNIWLFKIGILENKNQVFYVNQIFFYLPLIIKTEIRFSDIKTGKAKKKDHTILLHEKDHTLVKML